MRLDKYLKTTRLIKRRTIAQQLAKNNRIFRNGYSLKPSTEIRPGDELEIFYGSRYLKIRVVDEKRYEILEDKKFWGDNNEKFD
ncbi:S4 domain-containing protein [Thermosipho atlanticus]|uniref:S4 domain-containing protein n=1 Tax=Thermosipho atlanticus DSM 15807 TaxID=1123380 RepID=A0A1M5QY64_9BACT|nr:S4 domain-containing protein [Thermosipho atlanticus]SHH19084.1 S4 domain-containing protein [Thermosipho atlanticus DSM 15807]